MPFIPGRLCSTVTGAIINSKLDYGNALYAGLPSYQMDCLQTSQNRAVRLAAVLAYRDHGSDARRCFHWLAVHDRVFLKTLCFTHRAQSGADPLYIRNLFKSYIPGKTLQSSSQNLLAVPAHRLKSRGHRRLAIQWATTWDSLPLALRAVQDHPQFRKLLKTFLFA